MGRLGRFTFLVSDEERAAIKSLAAKLQRTESDAVRVVIREAVQELGFQQQPASLSPDGRVSSEARRRA